MLDVLVLDGGELRTSPDVMVNGSDVIDRIAPSGSYMSTRNHAVIGNRVNIPGRAQSRRRCRLTTGCSLALLPWTRVSSMTFPKRCLRSDTEAMASSQSLPAAVSSTTLTLICWAHTLTSVMTTVSVAL